MKTFILESFLNNAIFLFILGGIFIAFGAGLIIYNIVIKKQNTVLVKGKVVDIKPTKTYRGVYPVLEYLVNGKKVISQCRFSTTSMRYKLGETCDIKYNPNKPYHFHIVGENTIIYSNIALVICGIIIVVLGLSK